VTNNRQPIIDFFVPGCPRPGGSKRGFLHKQSGRIIITEAGKHTPRPRAHYGTGKNEYKLKASAPHWNTKAPDTTKLMRPLEDSLTGVIWKDDSQVVWQIGSKEYSDTPGARVRIYLVKDTDTHDTAQELLPLFTKNE